MLVYLGGSVYSKHLVLTYRSIPRCNRLSALRELSWKHRRGTSKPSARRAHRQGGWGTPRQGWL